MMIRNFWRITTFCLLFSTMAYAQEKISWAEEMTHTAMKLWKDPQVTGISGFPKWSYDEGVVLKGIQGVWQLTGNGDYFRYIQHSMDAFVGKDGSIATYRPKSYKLDDINTGKMFLMLYRVTGQQKYWKAASLLRDQLRTQPRTEGGGFWHKKIYAHQMWLDGLYMAEPFYAEYAMVAREDSDYADIARQFILMESHSRDPKTGLLYHGWDASRQQKWANKVTGDSPNFWDRAIGWYAMALVDALDYFPAGNSYRDSLTGILNRLAAAITQYQDPASGCWYQVMDKKGSPGNYLEASGSCMFVYALAKGVRKGYLPSRYLQVAEKGFKGILTKFIDRDANGQLNLKGTCAVAGLGGSPYRDGSYAYYVRQRPVTNDPKGIGAFILAADEMQIVGLQAGGSRKTVTLDNYFNHELKKGITGQEVSFHYVWDDMANSGFSLWGDIFRFRGAKTNLLEKAPTRKDLRGSDVYIIVDPDTKAESPDPHYIGPKDIKAIYRWVKKGGTLVLMANDSDNCEFTHFNKLAGKFGIHFNGDSRNRVQGHAFEQGAL
ncbi:MAG TPA: glycoside hydrolase family 88 protein, partial [Chitinophagaceae bacterium]|nr:glycoside hydrolase family 88 protein [Chitinophagaceae bacterium]